MKQRLAFFLITIMALFTMACGQSSDTESSHEQGDSGTKNNNASTENNALEGEIVVDGSGTVYPLMAQLAEQYMTTEQEQVSVEVGRSGTSAGFKKFLVVDGADFNNASRQIKDEEIEVAEGLDMNWHEMKVALDGLTFVIHPDNDWATELTDDELMSIFLNDDDITNWSDVRSEFPDEPIQKYGPNENHGTYEFFWENILDEQDIDDSVNLQQEYATLVNMMADDQYGIAFFGYGYYTSNEDKLAAVQVDFGSGPVAPSLDTIAEDGEYAPFTRPVFTYLNVDQAQAKPHVLDYALYVMENVKATSGEVGFAPLPDADIQKSIDFLESLK